MLGIVGTVRVDGCGYTRSARKLCKFSGCKNCGGDQQNAFASLFHCGHSTYFALCSPRAVMPVKAHEVYLLISWCSRAHFSPSFNSAKACWICFMALTRWPPHSPPARLRSL